MKNSPYLDKPTRSEAEVMLLAALKALVADVLTVGSWSVKNGPNNGLKRACNAIEEMAARHDPR